MSGARQPSFREMYGDELADMVAGITTTPGLDEAARKAEQERKEADRLAKHQAMANAAAQALRGDFGKEVKDSVTRVLAGSTPLKAPMASLVTCEAIVRAELARRRAARRPKGDSRGAK